MADGGNEDRRVKIKPEAQSEQEGTAATATVSTSIGAGATYHQNQRQQHLHKQQHPYQHQQPQLGTQNIFAQQAALGILPASSRVTAVKIPATVLRTVSSPVNTMGAYPPTLVKGLPASHFTRLPYFPHHATSQVASSGAVPTPHRFRSLRAVPEHIPSAAATFAPVLADMPGLHRTKSLSKFSPSVSPLSCSTSDLGSSQRSSVSNVGVVGPDVVRLRPSTSASFGRATPPLGSWSPRTSRKSDYSSCPSRGGLSSVEEDGKKSSVDWADFDESGKDVFSPSVPGSPRVSSPYVAVPTSPGEDTVFCSPSVSTVEICRTSRGSEPAARKYATPLRARHHFSFDPQSPSFLAHGFSFGNLPVNQTPVQQPQRWTTAGIDATCEIAQPAPDKSGGATISSSVSHPNLDLGHSRPFHSAPSTAEQQKIFKKQILERYQAESSTFERCPPRTLRHGVSTVSYVPDSLGLPLLSHIRLPCPSTNEILSSTFSDVHTESSTVQSDRAFLGMLFDHQLQQQMFMAGGNVSRRTFGEPFLPVPTLNAAVAAQQTSSASATPVVLPRFTLSLLSPPSTSATPPVFFSLQNSPISVQNSPIIFQKHTSFLTLPTTSVGQRPWRRLAGVPSPQTTAMAGAAQPTPLSGTCGKRSRSDSDIAFDCVFCGQIFRSNERLFKHMAANHCDDEQPSTSGAVCRRVGDEPRTPSSSLAKVSGSPGVRCHKCSVCQKAFSRSDMLSRHARLHTGIKPYACQACGQVFSRSDHLSTHQRTHTGEKPYHCPSCTYAASRRDMITRHMRTHLKSRGGSTSTIDQSTTASPPSTVFRRIGSAQGVEEPRTTDDETTLFLPPTVSERTARESVRSDNAAPDGTVPTVLRGTAASHTQNDGRVVVPSKTVEGGLHTADGTTVNVVTEPPRVVRSGTSCSDSVIPPDSGGDTAGCSDQETFTRINYGADADFGGSGTATAHSSVIIDPSRTAGGPPISSVIVKMCTNGNNTG